MGYIFIAKIEIFFRLFIVSFKAHIFQKKISSLTLWNTVDKCIVTYSISIYNKINNISFLKLEFNTRVTKK